MKIKITKDLLINHTNSKRMDIIKKKNIYKSLINDDMIKNNPEYYQNSNNENECIHLNPDYNPKESYEIYMNREIYREETMRCLAISSILESDEFEAYESDEESDDDYEEYEEDFESNNDIY